MATRIDIHGVICADGWGYEEDTMPRDVLAKLAECGDGIDLHIDSFGGDVLAANMIGNAIAAWCLEHPDAKCTCTVGSLAASAAANMLARLPKQFERKCFRDSLIMYHSAYGLICGGPEAMRDNAVMMDLVNDMAKNALKATTTLDAGRIDDAFREGRELWISGEEAKECGLVGELVDGTSGEIDFVSEDNKQYGLVASAIKSYKTRKESIMAEVDEKKILAAKAEEEEKEDVPPVDAEDDTEVDAACDDEKTDAKAEDVPEAPADEDPDAECGDDEVKQELEALKAEVAALKAENESLKAKYSVKATAKPVEPKKDFAQLVRELPKGLSQDKYAEAYSKLKSEHREEFDEYMRSHQTR